MADPRLPRSRVGTLVDETSRILDRKILRTITVIKSLIVQPVRPARRLGQDDSDHGTDPSRLAELKTEEDVRAFARQWGIAPGIVVRRLQHDGTIPTANGTD